jgi:hypothetical protein
LNRIKRQLLDFLARLLFVRWANPIDRVIDSVQVARPEALLRSIKVRQAAVIDYDYPAQFESFFRRTQAFPDRYVFELERAIVLKDRGIVLSVDGMILLESVGTVRRLFRHGSLLESLSAPVHPLHLPHPCSYLPCKPFYHFLLEELPALLYAWEQAEDLLVLADPLEDAPHYYTEALQMIFGKELAGRMQVIHGNVSAERYMLTQRDPFSMHIHPNDIQLLNRYFLPEPARGPDCRKLYISRREIPRRKIGNEPEVEIFLIKNGYQAVCLEDLNLQDQIGLTANCDFMVSPHGAGLSHLVWNPSRRKAVMEIFPSWVRNDSYASLARSLGYEYGYVVCDTKSGEERVNLSQLEAGMVELGML